MNEEVWPPLGPTLALLVARDGRLPAGGLETVAEAGGQVVVAGRGVNEAAAALPASVVAWTAELDPRPGHLATRLAPVLAGVTLVLLPASPDGRDLAPRLAATMGRPLLAGAVTAVVETVGRAPDDSAGPPQIHAELVRVDGRVVVPVDCRSPAVATLLVGGGLAAVDRHQAVAGPAAQPRRLPLPDAPPDQPVTAGPDAEILALVEPDPATMDLADATRVFAGGAGLVPRHAGDVQARALFTVLGQVAATLGASMGATRVATDAGWTEPERQIGTTGVAIDPELYVAFGVSGATQHVAGLGAPSQTVSVNTDPSAPMTALANLGLVADAAALLIHLAGRLGVALPPELEELLMPPEGPDFHA